MSEQEKTAWENLTRAQADPYWQPESIVGRSVALETPDELLEWAQNEYRAIAEGFPDPLVQNTLKMAVLYALGIFAKGAFAQTKEATR